MAVLRVQTAVVCHAASGTGQRHWVRARQDLLCLFLIKITRCGVFLGVGAAVPHGRTSCPPGIQRSPLAAGEVGQRSDLCLFHPAGRCAGEARPVGSAPSPCGSLQQSDPKICRGSGGVLGEGGWGLAVSCNPHRRRWELLRIPRRAGALCCCSVCWQAPRNQQGGAGGKQHEVRAEARAGR